jgi:ATP-dependent Lon protease
MALRTRPRNNWRFEAIGRTVTIQTRNVEAHRSAKRAVQSSSNGNGDDDPKDGKAAKDKDKDKEQAEEEEAKQQNKVYVLEPHEQMSVYLRHLSVTPTPKTVSVLPLNLNPSFSGTTHYVLIDKKLLNTLRQLWVERKFLGLFLNKEPGKLSKGALGGDGHEVPEVYQVGQLGCIIALTQYSASGVFLAQVSSVSRRIRIKSPIRPDSERNGLFTAEIEELIEEYDRNDPVIRANHEAIARAMQELVSYDGNPYYQKLLEEMDTDPADFADLAAAGISSEPEMQQHVLETLDVKERQQLTLQLLERKLEVYRRQKELALNIEAEELQKEQRKIYLEKQKKIDREGAWHRRRRRRQTH